MFYRIMPACFQNVVEANHVALDVSIRIRNGVPYTRLCAEIYYDVRVVLLENAVDEVFVRKVTSNKGIVLELLEFRQPCFLDADIVVVVHIVQTDDLGVRLCGKDALSEARPDKTGCTCDKYCFIHCYHFYPFLHTILLTTFTYP